MAHKKAGGSTKNGRDSHSKRLGVKAFGGELITAGSIIIRQRGTKFHPGTHVLRGGDDTLFTKVTGYVKFEKKAFKGVGRSKVRTYVHVIPAEVAA